MIERDAVASGTGRATQRHQQGRLVDRSKHATGNHRFHLKFAGSWSKIGGRRTLTTPHPNPAYAPTKWYENGTLLNQTQQ